MSLVRSFRTVKVAVGRGHSRSRVAVGRERATPFRREELRSATPDAERRLRLGVGRIERCVALRLSGRPGASPKLFRYPQAMATGGRYGGLARWVVETFGPLLAFLAFEHTLGLVAAIVASSVASVALVGTQIARDRKVSPFTAFIAASVLVFGALDLRYQTGFFVKIEPALGNAATGLFFLGSVLVRRPVIIELAERTSGRKMDKVYGYLTAWTVVWSVFFFIRASVYVWMAYSLSLDSALVVRGVVGPLSFGAMFLVEMAVRRLVYGRKAFEATPASPLMTTDPPPS